MPVTRPDQAAPPDDALACVRSGMRVFVHGAAATPTPLLEALARRSDLADVTLFHMHTQVPAPFTGPEHLGRFFSISLFAAPVRQAIDDGRAVFLHPYREVLQHRAEMPGTAHQECRDLWVTCAPAIVALTTSIAVVHAPGDCKRRPRRVSPARDRTLDRAADWTGRPWTSAQAY